MKKITLDVGTTIPFVLLLFLLVMSSLQIGASLNYYLTSAFNCLTLLIFFLVFKHKKVEIAKLKFFLPAILFEIYYILRNVSPYANKYSNLSIFYQAILFIILYIFISVSWEKQHLFILSIISFLIFGLLFYISSQSSSLVNTNSIGAYAYYIAFFPLIYVVQYSKRFKRFKILLIFLITLTLILSSDTRSILMAVVFGFVTFILWKIISKSKFIFNFYFFLYLGSCFFITVIYPRIDYYIQNFSYYNDLVFMYTGKNLLSGRQNIWNELLTVINQKLYFGYGSGALPSDFMNVDVSSHNLYLQITLQTGIIGTGLLILFLISIWNKLWINKQDKRVIIVACYLIGIIIHQTFEVSLTQNNFPIGTIQWLILGLGLSYCFKNDQKATP